MKGKWIFKFGDFELFHGIKYMMSRECRNAIIPAFWATPNFSHSVCFSKRVNIKHDKSIKILSEGTVFLKIDYKDCVGANTYVIPKGEHLISVFVTNLTSFCAIRIDGDEVFTDESWMCDSYNNDSEPVGTSVLLKNWNDVPGNFEFQMQKMDIVSDEIIGNERIIDFGRETFVKLYLTNMKGEKTNVFYGESLEETYSPRCVIVDEIHRKTKAELTARAARYIRFTGDVDFEISAFYPCPDFDRTGYLNADSIYGDIDKVSRYTLELCSRMFFLDGIKRDRWPWAGDTYLSVKSDFYSFFDDDIIRRTITFLRGNEDIKTSVNKVLPFSFYWCLSLEEYYLYTGDIEFIKRMYSRLKSLLKLHTEQANDKGFIPNIGAWNFIDWHDIEVDDFNCVIQMLYAKSIEIAAKFSLLLKKYDDNKYYVNIYKTLRESINTHFWSDELGAYVTTWYADGKVSKQVRRHQNYFGILFGFADETRTKCIVNSVLNNNKLPKITTPFFKFFECETMIKCGFTADAFRAIENFWGGMVKAGATTFWEEYDSEITGLKQYEMYGEPFDKSMCHAWGATPLYFVGKYVVGIYPIEPGYKSYVIKPLIDIGDFSYKVPVKGGYISVQKSGNQYRVLSDISGGKLILNEKTHDIEANKPVIAEFCQQ